MASMVKIQIHMLYENQIFDQNKQHGDWIMLAIIG